MPAGGGQAAFSVLFERHVQAVWNHAYRLTASWPVAEDLTADTFLTAWRKRTQLMLAGNSARPWLFAVAGNLARTEWRGARRRLRLLRKIPVATAVDDHAEQAAGQVDGERRLRQVLDAIGRLSRAEQQAVQLCLLGELSTADAAAALGIADVSMRARISRARARLRTLLEDQS